MIISVCYGETGEKRFDSLEKALKWACELDSWFYIWIDGELWMNVIERPDGTFRSVIFDSIM